MNPKLRSDLEKIMALAMEKDMAMGQAASVRRMIRLVRIAEMLQACLLNYTEESS